MPLIELSDAVKVVDGYKRRNPDSWSLCNSIRCDIEELSTLSPDDVRGVGEWIKAHDDVCWWWECSECHEQPLQRYKYDRLSNYCPSCGSRMKGAEDAE